MSDETTTPAAAEVVQPEPAPAPATAPAATSSTEQDLLQKIAASAKAGLSGSEHWLGGAFSALRDIISMIEGKKEGE